MSKVVLECNNLVKKMNRKEVIHNISFKINEGDIMGFILLKFVIIILKIILLRLYLMLGLL